MAAPIETLGDLRRSGAPSRPVKQEIRDNLVRKLQAGETLFPGIIGFDETVVPQLVNAILSRHNFILLGLRGQAKSRILRGLTGLLDERIAVVPGCEIHDDPLQPICAACRARVAREGDKMPIAWLTRDARYVEKLATPDVTIADMVGDIDPIKAAQAGLNLSDELTMHYGLLPRANRGIFAINELPDLAGKIQVGLFNILQEGDVQIKGYPIRLKLDVLLVFTANPEDYTARGKIITPLKDRIGSEIRTHYPVTRHNAIAITRQEAWTERLGARAVDIPGLRARGRRGGCVPGARRSQDRQAIRREPAPADHDARTGRLECGTPRARQRRKTRRPARDRHLRRAAFHHGQVRARVRRRAARGRAGGAGSDPVGCRQRLRRDVRRRRYPHRRRMVRPRRNAAACRQHAGERADRHDAAASRVWSSSPARSASPPARIRRSSPRRSTSSSKASTRRRRSAAATSADTPPPKQRPGVPRGARNSRSTKRCGFRAGRRSITTRG